MRVGVVYPAHTQVDPDTGEETQVEESIAAFRTGRIEPQTDIVSGETKSVEEVAAGLLSAAQEEHPDKEVRFEYLVHNGDGEGEGEEPDNSFEAGTSDWKTADEVQPGDISPKRGEVKLHQLDASVTSEAL